jgi:hypothetical protein
MVPKKSEAGDQPSTDPMFKTVPRRPYSSSGCASTCLTAPRLVRNRLRALASRIMSQPSRVHSCSAASPKSAALPRRVVEDVETTGEEGQDLLEKPLDLSWIRSIGGQHQNAFPADVLEHRSGFRNRLLRAAADHDHCAFHEETSRGRQADSAECNYYPGK